ncbi:MAG: hypothetical protein A3G41_02455 [Elusimicrobia bacterium RIFCSPLOWO2_12_FULL_59_9]|nr:MAG: hypothetical protein A3G41_02455 [Elusimicrobia bacterium RIFCSPLOWO2_12_FULL_59_9]
MLNKENNWASRYADTLIQADTLIAEESVFKVKEFLQTDKIDGAITFWEEDVPLLAKLCETFDFKGNSYEAALNARNKLRMRQVLQDKKLSKYSPKFAEIKTAKDLDRIPSKIGFPCVFKPSWGVLNQFVVRVDDLDEAKSAFEYLSSNMTPEFDPIYSYGTGVLCEGFLEGAEVDMDILLQDGQMRFYAFGDNFPQKGPFFVAAGNAMPSRHEDADLKNVLDMAGEVIAALGLRQGALHLESKIDADGAKLIEVNARMGRDYMCDWIKSIWGVDLIEEGLKAALGFPVVIEASPAPKIHLVGQYLAPESSGVISRLSASNPDQDPEKVQDLTLLKEIGDPVLVPPEGFDVIGWVVGRGDTYAQAEENANEGVKSLQISIAQFDPSSLIGKTRRRKRLSFASIDRKRIIQSARLERIRQLDLKSLRSLHVGILCNRYDENEDAEESKVQQDLTSVGLNIQKALQSKGYRTTFFDMNETPLPFDKMSKANVDIMFNVCERINNSSLLEPHGASILDCLGIPYTGSNPLTLALCIDKIKVKKILEYHSIPTPRFDFAFNVKDTISEDLSYPLIVKPANTDNSIGITNDSVVTSPKALKRQIEKILTDYNRPVLVEEYIEGDEVDVSIIGDEENMRVLPLSRSIFDDLPEGVWHIYPFEAKWEAKSIYEKIRTERPAKYSQKLTQLISEICLDVYNTFDCHDYTRIELRVDKFGNPFVFEVNPNPSINDGDAVPACAEIIGMNYPDFIEEILKNAVMRYRTRPPYYHLQSSLIAL